MFCSQFFILVFTIYLSVIHKVFTLCDIFFAKKEPHRPFSACADSVIPLKFFFSERLFHHTVDEPFGQNGVRAAGGRTHDVSHELLFRGKLAAADVR